MNDDVKEQNSTPREELRRQIMSYNEPKNEREWWAMHRIEQLEAALRIVMELSRKRSTHPMSPEADYFCIAGAALEGQDGEKV